jgi:hypothetical protein
MQLANGSIAAIDNSTGNWRQEIRMGPLKARELRAKHAAGKAEATRSGARGETQGCSRWRLIQLVIHASTFLRV